MDESRRKPAEQTPAAGPPFPIGSLIQPRAGGPAGEVIVYLRPAGGDLPPGWWCVEQRRDGGMGHLTRVSAATHRLACEVGG